MKSNTIGCMILLLFFLFGSAGVKYTKCPISTGVTGPALSIKKETDSIKLYELLDEKAWPKSKPAANFIQDFHLVLH